MGSEFKKYVALAEACEAQGFRVVWSNGGGNGGAKRFTAYPPDKSLSPVVVSTDANGHAHDRSFKNSVSDLRKRGLRWPPTRIDEVAPIPRGASISTALVAEAAASTAAKAPPETTPEPVAPPARRRWPAEATFGDCLTLARNEARLTQREVGECVGVTGSAVTQWENDEAIPVEVNYQKVLDLFPDLRSAPRPEVRDIPVPVGLTAAMRESAAPAEAALAPPHDPGRSDSDDRDLSHPPPLPGASEAHVSVSGAASPAKAANDAAAQPWAAPAPHDRVARAAVAFGVQLERVTRALDQGARDAVAALLLAAASANLSPVDVAEYLTREVAP